MVSIASRNRLRFTSLWGPIFEDFGGPTGPQKSISEPFFSMLFRNAFSYRILIDFWRLRTAKIAILLKENNDFCKIGVFDKGKKKLDLGSHLGGQTKENSIENRFQKISFFYIDFYASFIQFWLHFRFQKSLKNRNFLKKWWFESVL